VHRVTALAAAAFVLTVGLAGCTAAAADAVADTEPKQPSATAAQAWPELPEGLLATGTFEGQAHGSVQLLNGADGMLVVRVDDFAIDFPHDSGILMLPYHSYPDPGCGSREIAWGLGYDEEGVVPETYETELPLYGFGGDPSLIRDLIIRDFDAPGGMDECAATPAARAILTWQYEPLRTDLVAVDSGATGGARGETVVEEGVIVGYTVAPDDLLEEVAARFGMAEDDLRYLNPELGPVLRSGATITMNPAHR
jgi:hypothetical protein